MVKKTMVKVDLAFLDEILFLRHCWQKQIRFFAATPTVSGSRVFPILGVSFKHKILSPMPF